MTDEEMAVFIAEFLASPEAAPAWQRDDLELYGGHCPFIQGEPDNMTIDGDFDLTALIRAMREADRLEK